jgi:hypothetical protein
MSVRYPSHFEQLFGFGIITTPHPPYHRENVGHRLHLFEFDAQGPEEVVPVLHERHHCAESDERLFMRRSAIEMCEWNGKNYYFNNRKCFANSMLENGLLECVD